MLQAQLPLSSEAPAAREGMYYQARLGAGEESPFEGRITTISRGVEGLALSMAGGSCIVLIELSHSALLGGPSRGRAQ